MSESYTSLPSQLPPQKLSEKLKTKEWGQQSVRAIANKGNDTGNGLYRKTRREMQVAYDLINGKFDPADVSHVINPTNNPNMTKMGGLPARYQHYDIIASKLNELLGEEIKRPCNWRAYAVSGGVLNRQKEKQNQLILEGLQGLLLEGMGKEADPAQVPLEKVQDYFKTKYEDPAEVGANKLLKYLFPKLRIPMLFNKGFSHVLPVGEEIYRVDAIAGEPNMRVANPLYSSYDLDPDIDFIEDGQWFREERCMPVGAVIDEFREYLSDEDVAKLDRRQEGGSYSWAQQSGFAYDIGTDTGRDGDYNYYALGISPGSMGSGLGMAGGNLVCVVQVCWRSLREVGFLHYPDESGQMQQTLVDPSLVKLTREQKATGAYLETQWITDIWEGTLIGADIYVKVRPLPNQTGKLPYLGYVYSRLNSRATSLVDRVKALQYLYNVTWYRLENELAKAKGKTVWVDFAAIPRTGDIAMTTDEWFYYRDTLGVMFYDSSQEGNEGRDSRQLQMANSSIDQGLSSNIGQYISITRELKEMVGDIIGVSRQREGNVTSNETVGGVERAVSQSNNITEPIFYYHNLVKQNVLTQLLEVAKLCYADGLHGQYIIDDVTRAWLSIDGGLLNDSEYGVFLRDSSKDAAIIQKMEALADRMFQSGEVRASTILAMLDNDSVSENKAMLLQAEDAKDARDQQAAQMQQQQEAQAQAQALQIHQEEQEFTATQNALDRDNDIRKTYITATKGATGDREGGAGPDGLDFIKATAEQGKLSIAAAKQQSDAQLKQAQLAHNAQKEAASSAQKQQELGLKAQQHADNHALKATQLQLQAKQLEQDAIKFRLEQQANAKEQVQQNKMHADKQRHDSKLLELKNKEVKAKIKQANKPVKKK